MSDAGRVSKIRNLPVEVLGQIFVFGCPALEADVYRAAGAKGSQVRRHQVTVGSVCSHWRQISHGTPSLWITIVVYWPNVSRLRQNDPRPADYDNLLELSFERSRALGLDVAVIYPFVPSAITSKASNLLLEALPRICRLSVQKSSYTSGIDPCHTLFPLRNAPRLQELELMRINDVSADTSLFAKSHNVVLRELRLIECSEWLDLSRVRCDHVRTFVVFSNSAHAVQKIMARCPNLRKAKLLDISDAEDGFEVPASVRVLDFRYPKAFGADAYVPIIISSNLIHVSIHFGAWNSAPDRAIPAAAFPLPSLVSLSFCADVAWADHVVRILARAPNLAALELNQQLFGTINDRMVPRSDGNTSRTYDALGNVQLLRVTDDLTRVSSVSDVLSAARLWVNCASRNRQEAARIEWWRHPQSLGTYALANDDPLQCFKPLPERYSFGDGIEPALSDLDLYQQSEQ